MAIADAKQRKIGHELVEWIYLGVRTGARRSVAEYRNLLANRPDDALNQLKRAIDLPNRARARIDEWVRAYDLVNGAGSGQTFLGDCLSSFGAGKNAATRVSLSDINSELTTLENWAAVRVAAAPAPYGDGSKTWDDIATEVENQVEWEAKDWVFVLPAGYTDVWGE